MKLVKQLVCFSLMLTLTSSILADDTEKKGRKKGARKPTATKRFLAKIDLTDEQKTQVAAIDKKFAEKFTAMQKKMASILTDEQKEIQKKTQKSLREAGTKGAEARAAIQKALNFTDEQKAKQKELMGARKKLDAEIIAALKEVLTEEQQKALPKQKKQGGERKGKKKKKDDK